MEDEKIKYNRMRALYNKAKLLSNMLVGVYIGNDLTFNGYRLGLYHDIKQQAENEGDITFFCNADDKYVLDVKVSVTINKKDLIGLTSKNFHELMVVPTSKFNAVTIKRKSIGDIILEEI